MHRQPLLDLIDQYATLHPDEGETIERFREFVTAHPDCFERSLSIGHLTGAAWIVDATGDSVLLTHHRKLNCWLQLGGHADGDTNMLQVALREAWEESGLDSLAQVTPGIFDLDIHRIPERKGEPEHLHYDVRFVLLHPGTGEFEVSEESHDLAWVPLERLEEFTTEESMLRMARKWAELKQV